MQLYLLFLLFLPFLRYLPFLRHLPFSHSLSLPLKLNNMSIVKVGLVQMSCVADKEANLQKAIAKIRDAAAAGAQIVCLQELFTSLYFCDVEDYDNFNLAEPIPGPSTQKLSRVAQDL